MVSSSRVVGNRGGGKDGFGGDHCLALGVVSGRGYSLGVCPGSHILGRDPEGMLSVPRVCSAQRRRRFCVRIHADTTRRGGDQGKLHLVLCVSRALFSLSFCKSFRDNQPLSGLTVCYYNRTLETEAKLEGVSGQVTRHTRAATPSRERALGPLRPRGRSTRSAPPRATGVLSARAGTTPRPAAHDSLTRGTPAPPAQSPAVTDLLLQANWYKDMYSIYNRAVHVQY